MKLTTLVTRSALRTQSSNTLEGKLACTLRLVGLTSEFMEFSKRVAVRIVSERDCATKSVPPVSVGGHAGGDKFLVNNAVFKFIGPSLHLYDGPYNSSKTAGAL